MAQCYIVQKLADVARYGTGVCQSSYNYYFYWTGGTSYKKFTLTIPNIPNITSVTFEGNFYFDKGDFSYAPACSLVIKKGDTTVGNGYAAQTLNVSAGDTLTVEISIDAAMTGNRGNYGSSGMSITYDQMRFVTTVTLPSISEMQYASEVTRLANILNVAAVSAGSEMTRTQCQNIGTAVGGMNSSWNGSGTAATAVTFDSTEPKSANINACITNMTGKYAIRPKIE